MFIFDYFSRKKKEKEFQKCLTEDIKRIANALDWFSKAISNGKEIICYNTQEGCIFVNIENGNEQDGLKLHIKGDIKPSENKLSNEQKQSYLSKLMIGTAVAFPNCSYEINNISELERNRTEY